MEELKPVKVKCPYCKRTNKLTNLFMLSCWHKGLNTEIRFPAKCKKCKKDYEVTHPGKAKKCRKKK